MLRKLFYFLPLAPLIIAFGNLIWGDMVMFFAWITIAALLALASFPIAANKEDGPSIPITQIFLSLGVFVVFFAVLSYFDFSRLISGTPQALLYSILGGIGTATLIMLIKGT